MDENTSPREPILSTLLRIIGAISVAFVLINAALLLYPGGTVMVREATLEGTASPAYIVRQSIFIALIPFVFSLLALVGILRKQLSFIWIGGSALVITGVLFLFSLGIYIAFVGIITLLVAFVLHQQTA